MKVNDVVKVCAVPDKIRLKAGHMVGRIGYVEQISPDGQRALVQRFTLEGRLASGMAWIPVTCLTAVTDPAWKAALLECRRYMEQIAQEQREREQRCRAQLETLGQKHGLTVEQLLEIGQAVNAVA